jgi:uncharacterized protein (TIGR00290 family)
MKILLSWSTGKDSAWALHVLRQQGRPPAALLTTLNAVHDRVAMHAVRHDVLALQAAAAGLPLRTVLIPSPCPNALYEERMKAAVSQAVADGFTHVAFGDLFLEDIRAYREERLKGTGLDPLFPLWNRPTAALAREMLAGQLKAYVTCVDPRAIDPSFAGRLFDHHMLDDLPGGVDPCGERGEFHTCVTAGPMFSNELPVRVGTVVERDGFVFADIEVY